MRSPEEMSNGSSLTAESSKRHSSLLRLPSELVLNVLSFLTPLDLACVAQTCRRLLSESCDDRIWQPLVNENLRETITTPGPCSSFRDLYVAHHPRWFLPKHRIWFGDFQPSGQLLVSRYDPERGCIEAYAVGAARGSHTLSFWEKNPQVVIHSFDPVISLDLNRPVVKLHAYSSPSYTWNNSYGKEILMGAFEEEGLYSSFLHCRTLPAVAITSGTSVWPPMQFSAHSRTRNDTQDRFTSSGHRPTRFAEVSQDTFRLRKWAEYTGRRSQPQMLSFSSNAVSGALTIESPFLASAFRSSHGRERHLRVPETIHTFATLPESFYMPTRQKPWQGIWCGDYSGHGCEFLVITQPDKADERSLPEAMGWMSQWLASSRSQSEGSDSSFVSAAEDLTIAGASTVLINGDHSDEKAEGSVSSASHSSQSSNAHAPPAGDADSDDVPSGRLEAIKLTGDPHIPRGEYTFVSPDIGPAGFIRIADEAIFNGARVVRSAGHIAHRGFVEGKPIPMPLIRKPSIDLGMLTSGVFQLEAYTPSQLILISHDRIAQFWEEMGHISYYQRVDLDALSKMA